MTLVADMLHERRTETVALLLMYEERGHSAADLASALQVPPHRLVDLMERGRNGELERVPAVGSAGLLNHAPPQRTLFYVGSLPANAAAELVEKGEMPCWRLLALGRTRSTTGSELRRRLVTGFIKADITLDHLVDGGLAVPSNQRLRARGFAASGWSLVESEDD